MMYKFNDHIKEIKKYYKDKYSLPEYHINSIMKYTNIKPINYLDKRILEFQLNKHYLLMMKSLKSYQKHLPELLLPQNFNYIILSDRPHIWYNFISTGIFINTNTIDYIKFNRQISQLKEFNNTNPTMIIKDSHKIDIDRLNIHNVIYLTIMRRNLMNKINTIKYDKIIIKIEPYVLSYLYNMFDSDLRKFFDKTVQNDIIKNENEYFIIDNNNLDKILVYYLV